MRLVVNVRLLVGIFLCQGLVPGADTIVPDPAITRESYTAQLSFLIPDNTQANYATFISIVLGFESKFNCTLVYLMQDKPYIRDAYVDRLSVTHIGKNVTMLLRNVVAADAGTYTCYPNLGSTIIPDCGQRLIVVRKPDPPVVKVLPSSAFVVGSDLHLVCVANSTSLPPDHGLIPEIFWFDQNRQSIASSSGSDRIHLNTRSELTITGLQEADKNFKCYCTSADNTNGAVPKIMSDPSNTYAVGLESKPKTEDFRLTPVFNSDDVVKKVIGEQLNYQCDADCQPQCSIVWFYKPNGGAAGIGQVTNLANRNVLTFVVSRLTDGLYCCKAENTHGAVTISFTLEALYISNPTTYVNGQIATTQRLLEDTRTDLSCVFDSNPGPFVTWRSPSWATLSSQQATGPSENMASNGICQRLYTSNHSLATLKCEDSGPYSCDGRNNVSAGEGKIHLTVMCPPSNAGFPGLDLASVYVWDISQVLTINFVIKAVPEPDITRIFSSIRGQPRKEEIPRDFVIAKSKVYDGKTHLTKFSLTSRRGLDQTDDGRIFTVMVESSEFTKGFVFTIRPRGPPWKVVNLTAYDIDHGSLILSWAPGFSGGEIQTFTLELQDTEAQKWTTVQSNISEPQAGNLVKVKVGSLKSGTTYVLKVTATTRLGSAATEIQVTTLEASDEFLGVGAIVGIILLVLAIIAVVAVIAYCVYYYYLPLDLDLSFSDEDEPYTRANEDSSTESSSSSTVESPEFDDMKDDPTALKHTVGDHESEDMKDDPTALKHTVGARDMRVNIKQAGDNETEIL